MNDRIYFTDIAEELVAQTFTLARAFHQTGDVDEGQLGWNSLGRFGYPGDFLEPLIRDRHLADIRFDRAKRIVRSLRSLRLGQCIEQGGLADIRQADDPAAETHQKLRI